MNWLDFVFMGGAFVLGVAVGIGVVCAFPYLLVLEKVITEEQMDEHRRAQREKKAKGHATS